MTLTLNFQSNIEFAKSQPKLSKCHETKIEHIDWTLSLKCEHRVWPWPWPWTWIFKVEYRICYISAKKWSDCHESKHIDWTLGLKCDHRFDLGHDLDFEFSKSNKEFAIPQPKWSDCHKTKSKHIHGTPALKCDQWVWPWPLSWPLNFHGQMWPWPLTTHMALTMDTCIAAWEDR